MNLKYKILWVENDKDWVDSIKDSIEEIVIFYGFELDVKLIAQDENVDYNLFDLILMDLNLADQPTGDQLIKKIRNIGVFTNVVFYTAGGADVIKSKIESMALEGVFYSDRGSDGFVEKVKKVMEASIKKTQDLNNLRGLVMAEVSELDAMMDDIIAFYFSDRNNNLREQFNNNVIKRDREKTYKKSLNPNPNRICEKDCSLNWVDLEPTNLIKVIDASMKARALKYIIEFVKKQNADSKLVFDFDNYKKEIIDVRNDLAHCDSVVTGDKEVLKTRKGDVIFENKDFKNIRNDIRKYNQIFSKLRDNKSFFSKNNKET